MIYRNLPLPTPELLQAIAKGNLRKGEQMVETTELSANAKILAGMQYKMTSEGATNVDTRELSNQEAADYFRKLADSILMQPSRTMEVSVVGFFSPIKENGEIVDLRYDGQIWLVRDKTAPAVEGIKETLQVMAEAYQR